MFYEEKEGAELHDLRKKVLKLKNLALKNEATLGDTWIDSYLHKAPGQQACDQSVPSR